MGAAHTALLLGFTKASLIWLVCVLLWRSLGAQRKSGVP